MPISNRRNHIKTFIAPAASALALTAACLQAAPASSAIIINAVESSGSVLFSSEAGGSLNIDSFGSPTAVDFTAARSGQNQVSVAKTGDTRHDLQSLPDGLNVDRYDMSVTSSPSGWLDDLANNTTFSSDSSGIPFLLTSFSDGSAATTSRMYLPTGYVSGQTLGTFSFSIAGTFDTTGLNPGTYAWTWAAGTASQDSVILSTSAPSPSPPPSPCWVWAACC